MNRTIDLKKENEDQKKKLGFGLMRMPLLNPDDPADVDVEQVKEMVDMFMAAGFTYFDTAYLYHNYKSEQIAKAALVDRYPREAFTLATKMHEEYFAKGESLDDILEGSLKRCGVEYFDYYLAHDMGHDNYPLFKNVGIFEWMKKKKEEGVFRHIGFSCHDDADFVDRVLNEHPEMEFVQLQINYLDWDSAGINSHASYDTVTRHGKDVIVMEPVKGGNLVRIPEEAEKLFRSYDPDASNASWAIRFAASLENVKVVLSGMTSIEQMQDNLAYMSDFKPLNSDEYEIIEKACEIINETIAIPCTACSYCTSGCPMNIPIPRYFSIYNAEKQEIGDKWSPNQEYYLRLAHDFGKASDCIECGQCEGICPQHLPIIDDLKEVAELFEH